MDVICKNEINTKTETDFIERAAAAAVNYYREREREKERGKELFVNIITIQYLNNI